MELGIVTAYNEADKTGEITSVEGDKFKFNYLDGQNMIFREGAATPELSGEHAQPNGYLLKQPDIGDPIAYKKNDKKISNWGYARHYIDLIEQRFPTKFAHMI